MATIPDDMRSRLAAALGGTEDQTPNLASIVPGVIQASLEAFEENILADFMALFPGGLDAVKGMSDEEINSIVNDGGVNHTKAIRTMHGSTALVTLVDPKKENIWVASLGDGQASKSRILHVSP